MQTRTFALVTSAVIATVAVGGLVAATVLRTGQSFADCRGGQAAGDLGGPFTLVNSAGETVTEEDVVTRPSIVYFGFTNCPDVCPIDNARNARAVELLEERGVEAQPVFISVDPERDTPEVMGEYSANFHERMIGLTGTPEQVKAAAQEYRVYYQAQEPDEDGYYSVDHSAMSYLVLPGEGFVDFYRRDTSAEQVADSVECFAAAAA